MTQNITEELKKLSDTKNELDRQIRDKCITAITELMRHLNVTKLDFTITKDIFRTTGKTYKSSCRKQKHTSNPAFARLNNKTGLPVFFRDRYELLNGYGHNPEEFNKEELLHTTINLLEFFGTPEKYSLTVETDNKKATLNYGTDEILYTLTFQNNKEDFTIKHIKMKQAQEYAHLLSEQYDTEYVPDPFFLPDEKTTEISETELKKLIKQKSR